MATKATTKKAATKTVKKESVSKAKAAVKTPAKVVVKSEEKAPAPLVAERYVCAVGRRKTAIAQVRLYPSTQAESATVNERPISAYFGTEGLEAVALSPLKTSGLTDAFRVSVVVRGSGLHSQAVAIRLGVARCLIKHDPLLRAPLKVLGFLTRDARMVERKKPGFKKARRSPQWAKR